MRLYVLVAPKHWSSLHCYFTKQLPMHKHEVVKLIPKGCKVEMLQHWRNELLMSAPKDWTSLHCYFTIQLPMHKYEAVKFIPKGRKVEMLQHWRNETTDVNIQGLNLSTLLFYNTASNAQARSSEARTFRKQSRIVTAVKERDCWC
jgi:hypothetical protein